MGYYVGFLRLRFPSEVLLRMLRKGYHYWLKDEFKGMWLEFDVSRMGTIVNHLNLFSFDFTDTVFSNVAFAYCTFIYRFRKLWIFLKIVKRRLLMK